MIPWMNGRGFFFVIKKKKDEQKKNYRVWIETKDLGWGTTSDLIDWLICFKI